MYSSHNKEYKSQIQKKTKIQCKSSHFVSNILEVENFLNMNKNENKPQYSQQHINPKYIYSFTFEM